jgi:hypothetical protein
LKTITELKVRNNKPLKFQLFKAKAKLKSNMGLKIIEQICICDLQPYNQTITFFITCRKSTSFGDGYA